MTDPLLTVKRLSGINTVAIYTKDAKRIVLLGDMHTSTKGLMCSRCHANTCYTVAGFIRALADYSAATKTQFDLFGEFYAPTYKDIAGSLMVKIANLESKQQKHKLLFQMRSEFAREVYLHGHKKSAVRYHYVDVRTAPYVQAKGIGLILRVRPDYDLLIQAAFPTHTAFTNIILELCLSSSNKIHKQYQQLPLAQRKLVRSWLLSRVRTLSRFRWSFKTFTFWMEALLMDFYAVCRFLRYFARQPAGSTSVFFAGAGHTLSIGLFLQKWGAQQRISTASTERLDVLIAAKEEEQSKCIHLGTK
jgi:hypothetical protein